MPGPGYGPNGERLDPPGAISWETVPTATPVVEGWDRWDFPALGAELIPYFKPADQEVWKEGYL